MLSRAPLHGEAELNAAQAAPHSRCAAWNCGEPKCKPEGSVQLAPGENVGSGKFGNPCARMQRENLSASAFDCCCWAGESWGIRCWHALFADWYSGELGSSPVPGPTFIFVPGFMSGKLGTPFFLMHAEYDNSCACTLLDTWPGEPAEAAAVVVSVLLFPRAATPGLPPPPPQAAATRARVPAAKAAWMVLSRRRTLCPVAGPVADPLVSPRPADAPFLHVEIV